MRQSRASRDYGLTMSSRLASLMFSAGRHPSQAPITAGMDAPGTGVRPRRGTDSRAEFAGRAAAHELRQLSPAVLAADEWGFHDRL
jgi:hypothetical protein